MGLLQRFKAYLAEEDLKEPSEEDEELIELEEVEKGEHEEVFLDDEVERVTKELNDAIAERNRTRDETPPQEADEADDLPEGSEEDAGEENVEDEDALKKKSRPRKKKKRKSLRQWLRNLYAETDDEAWDYEARIRRDVEMHQEVISAKRGYSERKACADFCEQLVDVTYQMEDLKREYKLVTSYLIDIQKIDELPIDLANEIRETARRIEMLDKSRQTYLQSENLLPMEDFNLLQRFEDEIPETVKRLNDMEMRDSMLKSDMSHLEGEKEDLKYMREEFSGNIHHVRGIVSVVFVLFFITMAVLGIVALTTRANVLLPALIAGAVLMLAFAISYVRYIDLKNEIKITDAKLKRAVSLLNKVKAKYIQNTSTVEYIYEKYNVNSCKQLEYNWALYNQMLHDAMKYSQANTDFRLICDELVDQLSRIGLADPLVWPKQIDALLDHREMVEIKHSLNQRRQKLREQLATYEKIKENAKTALRAAAADDPNMEGYIKEVLASYKIKLE